MLATRRIQTLGGAVLLTAVIAIAFAPALRGGYVFDDELVTANPFVQSADGCWRVWDVRESLDPWPLTTCSLWLEWRIWKTDARGYHASNVALHAVSVLLLWRVLRGVYAAPVAAGGAAFIASLLFAVHPVNVQSVAWITQRKNLLAMVFLLLSSGAYLVGGDARRGNAGKARLWQAASVASFTAAMLSKASTAPLPLLLLVIRAVRRRLRLRDLYDTAPYFAVVAVLLPVNLWVQSRRLIPTAASPPIIERALGAAAAIWFYLGKALLPLRLAFVYPQWTVVAGDLRWWLPLAATVAVTIALWAGRRGGWRPVALSWAFFCIALLPVIGLSASVYIAQQSPVADHYQHIALLGVVASVGGGLAQARARLPPARRTAIDVSIAAAIIALMTLTHRQAALYRDDVTLFADAARKYPASARAHHNLAFVLARSGELAAARAQYERALQLQPDDPEAHNNFGALLARLHEPRNAIEEFRTALQLRPDHAGARNNLGALLQESGDAVAAVAELTEALRLQPDFPQAHRNLGNALMKLGRRTEAAEHYRTAMQLTHDAALQRELDELLAQASTL